jgi:hypothetical protein
MVDATKVSKIRIKTEYGGERKYSFFTRTNKKGVTQEDAQFAIVLGKNGSGKSTIARALSTETSETKFFDKDENFLGSDCSNVHVFSESYVVKNFRTRGSGNIDPVILFGDFVHIRDRIDNLKNLIKSSEKRIGDIKSQSLNRLLEGESSFVDEVYGESKVKDYLRAYIDNLVEGDELPAYSDDGQYGFVDKGELYFNVMKQGFESQERYVDCVAYTFNAAHRKIMEKYENSQDLADCSVGFIREKLRQLDIHIRQSSQAIREGVWEAGEDLSELWWKMGYWLMLLIYKESESLYEKINKEVVNEDELLVLSIIQDDLIEYESQIRFETRRLEEKRREYSPQRVTKYINQLLDLVFNGRRIWLEPDGASGYTIKSEGGIVPPARLSTGEQNILSLCYFFAEIASDGELDSSIRNNIIIVLDDPISSIDSYNKAGLNAMIDWIAGVISADGSASKMIIMTHSLSVAKDLSRSLRYRVGGPSGGAGWKVKFSEIIDSQEECLKAVGVDALDDYRNILLKMYKVAISKKGEDVDFPHSNDVRRIWEAFLRTELGENLISTRSAIHRLSYFYDDKSCERKFLESFTAYNYINHGSHSADQILDYEFELSPQMELEEFRDQIRQIILFMRLVSPHHIPCRMAIVPEEINSYKENLEKIYLKIVFGKP